MNAAKVIAVGPGDRDKNGNVIPVSVKEGDEVLLPEYGGTEVKLGDKVYAVSLICSLLAARAIVEF
jgi:chaperonin GroES